MNEHRDVGCGSQNPIRLPAYLGWDVVSGSTDYMFDIQSEARWMQQVQHPISRRHHAMCQLAGWTVAGVMLMLPGLHAMSMGQHGLLRGQRRMLPVRR